MNQTPNKTIPQFTGPFAGLRRSLAGMPPQRRSFFLSFTTLLVLLAAVSLYKVYTTPHSTQAKSASKSVVATTQGDLTAATAAPADTSTMSPTATHADHVSQATAATTNAVQSAPTALVMPIQGGKLEEGFRWVFNPALNQWTKHTGLDWSAPVGTTVAAAAPGKVIAIQDMPGLGNTLRLDVGGGMVLEYSGMNPITANVGDMVVAGQSIGKVGNVENSAAVHAPHLNFAVLSGKEHIDPSSLLPSQQASQQANKPATPATGH